MESPCYINLQEQPECCSEDHQERGEVQRRGQARDYRLGEAEGKGPDREKVGPKIIRLK